MYFFSHNHGSVKKAFDVKPVTTVGDTPIVSLNNDYHQGSGKMVDPHDLGMHVCLQQKNCSER